MYMYTGRQSSAMLATDSHEARAAFRDTIGSRLLSNNGTIAYSGSGEKLRIFAQHSTLEKKKGFAGQRASDGLIDATGELYTHIHTHTHTYTHTRTLPHTHTVMVRAF